MNYLKLLNDDYIASEYEKLAYKTIVADLIVNDIKGIKRAVDLEYWSDEEEFARYGGFIPGNFYIFLYDGEKVTQGKDTYHDKVPVMLALGVADEPKTLKRYVYGLNFNLLPGATRAVILQEINDYDKQFFETDVYKAHSRDRHVFSKKVLTMLQRDGGLSFVKMISEKYKIDKNSFAFRRYYMSRIVKYRMIDMWQWKYLPFLDYKEGIRGAEIKKIQSMNAKNGKA